MVKVSLRFVLSRKQKSGVLWYWNPPKRLRGSLRPVRLGRTESTEPTAEIVAKAAEMNGHYDAMRQGGAADPIPEGSLAWLIGRYLQDDRYESLGKRTQYVYRHTLNYLQNQPYAVAPVREFTRQHALKIYDAHRATPRKAEEVVKILRLLFNLARDIGLVEKNPFTELRVRKNPPREQVWEAEQIEAIQQGGGHVIALAVQLALDTGQRPGDVLAMTWNQYDGQRIRLRQQKTGKWVEIAATATLRGMLDAMERKAVLICPSPTGRAYSVSAFSRDLRQAMTSAGLPREIQFRDLRRTAVVRMAEAGCEIPEIAAVTGHDLDETLRILKTYMPMTSKMADNAIAKVERISETSRK